MKLHLFNPENDLALALDLANYTPPPAATALGRSGATLPLWYGEAGDAIVCPGVNAEWLRRIKDGFGLQTGVWDHQTAEYEPTPWGWSKSARKRFSMLGFDKADLPSDDVLERMRLLSSRRSSCTLGKALADAGRLRPGYVAEEIRSAEDARAYCLGHDDALFKLPWSSSGRGQIRVKGAADLASREEAIRGALRRYGFLTAEPFHRNKAADLALLFNAEPSGRVVAAGLSLFMTAPNGDYAGNVLASDAAISEAIERRFGIADDIRQTEATLRRALEALIGGVYAGPLGVDMMILSDGELIGCVELNLRMTMGHVARRFHDRHCAPGSTGLFTVGEHADAASAPAEMRDGRLVRGHISLNPPGNPVSFTAGIQGEKNIFI